MPNKYSSFVEMMSDREFCEPYHYLVYAMHTVYVDKAAAIECIMSHVDFISCIHYFEIHKKKSFSTKKCICMSKHIIRSITKCFFILEVR